MDRVIHVSPHGSDEAEGSAASPLRTIDRAAQLAVPGDTVMAHAGEYREWVRPARGGLSDRRRITYTAAPGEHVVIKGSERLRGWVPLDGSVWRAEIPNELFGGWNPFAETLDGDWIVYPPGAPKKHLGEVYLHGRSFYEVASVEEVTDPPRRTEEVDHWTGVVVPTHQPDQTTYVWHAEVGPRSTTVHANFHGADPNTELVEINVRRSVFSPVQHHVDYITVRGFEMAHAATPWAPPTADQAGLIGPNWAKGWVIEDNVIRDSKCVGISIGKEASTGHNFATERGDKPGYQYQLESVFAARHVGWDREHIGSHVIRRNTILDCGQAGIVGHLGCVFSTIEDNHIHDIALKREFYGYEIAGIKLHAAIDVEIRHNRIHDTSLGIWLDWQAQGTRVSRNLLYRNNRDLFVEVSHGPYLVEHNVLASRAAIEDVSQGGAFVNNLVGGTVRLEPVPDRATPYHLPHSTQVAGVATIAGGDDRYLGNIFLGGDVAAAYAPGGQGPFHLTAGFGTAVYDECPASFEEYVQRMAVEGDHERFLGHTQPVVARANAYATGARPFRAERDPRLVDGVTAVVVDEGDQVFLEVDVPPALAATVLEPVGGGDLGRVRFPGMDFEERDGSPARIDVDLVGARKESGQGYPAGPLAELPVGRSRIRVW